MNIYFEKSVKRLNVRNSDNAVRLGFRNGNDEFPTRRRPLKHRRRCLSGTPRHLSDQDVSPIVPRRIRPDRR